MDERALNEIIQGILGQNKALAKIYNPANTSIILASPERVQANQMYGGGGGLEFWRPEESGPDNFPHPSAGKYAFEIYDPELMLDPDALRRAVYGDMLHGMVKDPVFSGMRDEFIGDYTPQSRNLFERKMRERAGERNQENTRNSIHDSYIRGYLSPDKNDEWRKDHERTRTVWSPKQIEIMERMRRYLQTGEAE